MRIKKLEIAGFKSFAERAHLVFGDGITGVVGPNGCGKSNVVDALRWCMGEMSAKHLRGRAMQDVIFAGSDSRGPLGMAEVTITFKNDGNVPPQYAPFEEIAVTRRLHKDGTSEYLVNKVPARLRDITDLFLGTGVGTRAYSIIEQGRIGFIVSSKPEDRRTLIEEVAGITKFKVRKKAAERRMESTQQNLLRVNDIVTELERQLASLRRQAKKAERYRELKTELRDLELHAASVDYLRLCAAEKLQRSERERLETSLSDAQLGVGAQEASLEAERARLFEVEQALQAEQAVSAELDRKLAALERDLAHWKQKADETGERAAHTAREVEEAQRRIGQVAHEREQLDALLGSLEGSAVADSERRQAAEAAVQSHVGLLSAVDRDLEAARKDAVEHIHGAAQQRSHLASLERRRVELNQRLEGTSRELGELEVRRTVAQGHQHALAARRDEATQQVSTWRDKLAALRVELEAATQAVGQTEHAYEECRHELSARRSRLSSLEEIAQRFEGYSDGVRTLMGHDGQGPALAGLGSVVADAIDAPPELERAVEAALGDALQYLIVDDHQTAQRAVEFLRAHDGGRGGFVPASPRSAPSASVPAAPGVRGSVLDLVTVRPDSREVAQALLGHVVIVEDIAAALAAYAANEAPRTYVTLEGEVLDPHGALCGGSGEGAGLLAKRREIRELTELCHRLALETEAARTRHEAQETARLQLEVSIQQLEKDIHAAELERLELTKDTEAATAEVARLAQRTEVLSFDHDTQRRELAELADDENQTRSAAAAAGALHQAVEGRIAELADRRSQLAGELAQRSAALTELKVELATRAEKLEGARLALRRLEATRHELEGRVERGLAGIKEGDALQADLQRRIAEGAELAGHNSVEAQARRDAVAEARARYERDRLAVSKIEQEVREQRRAGDLTLEALTQLKMDVQRLELERVRLIEQIAERHDVQLLLVLTDYHLRPMPGAEETQRRLELDKSVKSMGPINLTAIEECQEIETRYSFLVKQRDDLSEALDSLKRAIQRINRASRERFQEAFDSVNEMFKQVYPRLFRGGEARLELTSSEDLLEAGVEIVAQPPGKKLQSVSLLSGGEKALTATALIFAIFLIKPSPFCVLDEVDAPLDEANVGRFNELLREISKISQFIVITHNKNTMQQADRLYGITMQEPGMSTVVSVDLERQAESAA